MFSLEPEFLLVDMKQISDYFLMKNRYFFFRCYYNFWLKNTGSDYLSFYEEKKFKTVMVFNSTNINKRKITSRLNSMNTKK